jgi:universal stress protein uspA
MKKILFPTDFSDTANNAFLYTLHLAKLYNAEVFVTHIYDKKVISTLYGGQPELVATIYVDVELDEFEYFKEESKKLRMIAEENNLSDVKLNFIFKSGSLVSTLGEIIEKEKINLVVMGTSGATNFEKKLWGSNTMNALRSLDIPILSIPKKAIFKGVKNIGFASALKDSDKPILANLLNFYDDNNLIIKVLYIIKNDKNTEVEEQLIDKKIASWESEFRNEKLIFIKKISDSVTKGIYQLIFDENIDIVVIAKRDLSFIDSLFTHSLSEDLAKKMDFPLLVVK